MYCDTQAVSGATVSQKYTWYRHELRLDVSLHMDTQLDWVLGSPAQPNGTDIVQSASHADDKDMAGEAVLPPVGTLETLDVPPLAARVPPRPEEGPRVPPVLEVLLFVATPDAPPLVALVPPDLLVFVASEVLPPAA